MAVSSPHLSTIAGKRRDGRRDWIGLATFANTIGLFPDRDKPGRNNVASHSSAAIEVLAVCEPPPEGIERIKDRPRTHWVENPETGQRYETRSLEELGAYQRRGWKWILDAADRLEDLHMQAWYFQVRHFPRLQWTRLDCPQGEYFVTSDRALAWLVDGLADTPPAALRHPTATVVASLTRSTALIGRNQALPLRVSPRHVNRLIAFAASDWIAGPTRSVVEEAIKNRDEIKAHTASHDNTTTPN